MTWWASLFTRLPGGALVSLPTAFQSTPTHFDWQTWSPVVQQVPV